MMRRLNFPCTAIFVGLLLAAATLTRPAAAEEPLRKWLDSSGQYEFAARLVKVQGDNVVLKGTDNLERTVSLDKLSAADREFLKSREISPAPGPLPSRIWTPSEMPPFEAGFVDLRLDEKPSDQPVGVPNKNFVVVLRATDGRETLLPFDRLSEADREYLANRTVVRSVPDVERERLARNVEWNDHPEVVHSLVVVEAATVDGQTRSWPAFIVQTIDKFAYIRTEPTNRPLTDDALPFTNVSIVVRGYGGTRHRVSAERVSYTDSFSRLLLRALADQLPKPLTDFKPNPIGNEQPVTLYGIKFNGDASSDWGLYRCAATFRKRSPEYGTFEVDAGVHGTASLLVIGAGNSYCGVCSHGKSLSLHAPDGSTVERFAYRQIPFRAAIEPGAATPCYASAIRLRKTSTPGLAEITFIWNELLEQDEIPLLIAYCAKPNTDAYKAWLEGRASSTVPSFDIRDGKLSPVVEQTMRIVEFHELRDEMDAAEVLNASVPKGIRSPGNQPMVGYLPYDHGLLGDEFPVALAIVRFDWKSGKYLGDGEVRMQTTVSFKKQLGPHDSIRP